MRTIYLLRAYGDFLIALYSFRNSLTSESIKFIASKHHEELYNALPQNLLPKNIVIKFWDFGIDTSLLRLFTNKYVVSFKTVQQIKRIREQTKGLSMEDLFVEQKKRRYLLRWLTGIPFKSIVDKKNVYDSYSNFFSGNDINKSQFNFSSSKEMKILMLPDGRQKWKNITDPLITEFKNYCHQQNLKLTICYFNARKSSNTIQPMAYSNFKELVQQVDAADFLICADSMPAHLAQFLNKPHFIFYKAKSNHSFLTPFAMANNCFANFNEFEKFKTVFNTSK